MDTAENNGVVAAARSADGPAERRRGSVSVVVPAVTASAAFRRCLESLGAAQSTGHDLTCAIDGGDPAAIDMARRFGARVVVLRDRSGPAAARNAGARAATGDVLLFLDADVEAPVDLVERIRRIFGESPDLDALIGSYDDAPYEPGFLSQYRNLLHHYVHQRGRREAATFWGACGAIRRDVFLAVGGFDADYDVPCIEDVELGHRLKARGHRIALRPDVQVKHGKRWTATSIIAADVFRRALPWSRLILRSGRLDDDLNTRTAARVQLTLVALATALTALAPVAPILLGVALATLVPVVANEWDKLRFFARVRSRWFAACCVPWLLGYHLCCLAGLSLAVGALALQPLAQPRGARAAVSEVAGTPSA